MHDDILRKPKWHKLTRMFSGPDKKILEIQNQAVLVEGFFYDAAVKCSHCGEHMRIDRARVADGTLVMEPTLAVCTVSPAISGVQSADVQRMLNASLRTSVILLTNNVQLLQLQQISQAQAQKILNRDEKTTNKQPS